ncbi:hypothetical protein [Micromonospora sp. Llam0]|uniref:hypothetical protein n=1 Tax=Micromonospora sp. Llam0 TaxID=2485143 RepID=UPI0011CD5F2D|nr:hypothetical protein [Micromonospora sp. Llam0]
MITFLILHGGLRPGYDYLLERKFSSIWREVQGCQVGADLAQFLSTAAQLGFAERVRLATASQVPARLLIQTSRPLNRLTDRDIDAFTYAWVCKNNGPGLHPVVTFGSCPEGSLREPSTLESQGWALSCENHNSARYPIRPNCTY